MGPQRSGGEAAGACGLQLRAPALGKHGVRPAPERPGQSTACRDTRPLEAAGGGQDPLDPARLAARSLVALKGPQVTHNFCLTWLQIRGSQDPFLGLDHLLELFTEFRKILMFTGLLYNKGYDKGYC